MSSAAPSRPPDDPIEFAALARVQPVNDPVADWIQGHLEELRPHAGQRTAIHPARGLLAVGDSYEAVAARLAELGEPADSRVVIVPLHV